MLLQLPACLPACLPAHLLCSFLEESAVFLADEPMSDVEAMLWVLSLEPELREAKRVGLAALRAEMYDRNLQVGLINRGRSGQKACTGWGVCAWWGLAVFQAEL